MTQLGTLAAVALIAISCSAPPKIKVGVSQCSTDDWREKMNQELVLEAQQHPGVLLEILSADNDNEKQIEDIEHFIQEGVDVLIVSPREAEAITPSISKARAKGIKVLVFDRETDGTDYDVFYGADNRLIGHNAAIYIRNFLTPSHTPDNPMRVVELRGLDGSSPARGRSQGFREGLAESGGRIRLMGSAANDWTPETARRSADSLFRIYPDAELVYAHNDRMALAARASADSLGLNHVRIIGVDGAPKIGLEGVKSGKLNATFMYPTDGDVILQTALALYNGEPVGKRIIAESAMAIDSTNVDLQFLSAHTLDHATDQIRNLNDRVSSYRESRETMTALLWVGFALLVSAAFSLFILLRFYWSRKRSQELVEHQNETLREQRDNLRELNERLNEATQAKINFFTNVSHDLRTPLTLISAPLEALADSADLNERNAGLLRVAMKNVKILRRLINQVLDFQKYDQGKLELELSETDITSAVMEWADSFRAAARRKNIKIKIDAVPDTPCIVTVDREKMERVFFNIMSNAFKYTPANGHIDISLNTEGENIELRISDDGKGIPAESLPKLFEQFYQVRAGNAGGSGIGLAVVRNFVELHGGTVRAESPESGGATFIVTIPKQIPATAEGAVGSVQQSIDTLPENHESSTGKDIETEVSDIEIAENNEAPKEEDENAATVLIIDDNPDIRVLVKALLDKEYTVISAPDGEAGIRMASRYVPDCVVSDVMMPGIDGLEVTRRLKGETVTSHIPVILLTACGLDEQRVAGYDSGADGYIAKPFNEKVLLARIRSVIANRRLLEARPGAEVPIPEIPSEDSSAKKSRKAPAKNSSDPFSEIDSSFYRNFVEIVGKELGNADLTVEELASRCGMSRVQFYRKIKALTNYSPADLLRLMRLRRAKELLVGDSELTVAEVGYQVGFSSPSYFAKCYKTQFGELPSETQQRTSRLG